MGEIPCAGAGLVESADNVLENGLGDVVEEVLCSEEVVAMAGIGFGAAVHQDVAYTVFKRGSWGSGDGGRELLR